MPQKRIPLQPGHFYHIWTHANGSENLFRCDDNYRYFLEKYQYHVHPTVETYAYCLMPNHLHLMVKVKEEDELVDFFKKKNLQDFQNLGGLVSQQFSNLFNAYTKAFNKMYDRKGSLFIPNFKRKQIDSDPYFVQLIAYIHNNPVHHGFTEKPEEWSHSSFYAYLQSKSTRIQREKAMHWFGSRNKFLSIHHEIRMEKWFPLFEE